MNHKIKIIQLFLFLCLLMKKAHSADNCLPQEFSVPITTSVWRNAFIFPCYSPTQLNPNFPTNYVNQAAKYNQLVISPNFFTYVPYTTLCLFKYAATLNMRYNYITSLKDVFSNLKCLTALSQIDFSSNIITSPILASDFDDSFALHITSLNLTNNSIPFIESRAFLTSDGRGTRFTQLTYLGLAMNKIKDFDILWPLTIPSVFLKIDMRMNQIENLVNQFGLPYSNTLFSFDMVANRSIDLTNNMLQIFSDSNLLQYGLNNENDLFQFLNKIRNYDFRQSNFVNTISCNCPPQGLQTVFWYQLIKKNIDPTLGPIFQLYCINKGTVFVLDFECGFTSLNTGTTTTTQVATPAVNQSGSGSVSNLINQPNPSMPNNNLYYLLFLLTIPVSVIGIFSFMCCFGRPLQIFTSRKCNFVCCPCMRPNDKSHFNGKSYDATICFNRFDESWIDDEFIRGLLRCKHSFKIHKLSFTGRAQDKISRENEKILRSSKRIILMFTNDFVEDEFRNRAFLALLRNICFNDPDCVIIAVNKGVDEKIFNYYVDYLDSPLTNYSTFEKNGFYEKKSCCSRLMSTIKYHCALKEVERLPFGLSTFWKKFFYVMPFVSCTKSAVTDDTVKRKLSYSREYKDPENLRHIVIPIPDFMKTRLGFTKKNKTHSQIKSMTHNVDASTMNNGNTAYKVNYSYQQQDPYISRDLFTSVNSNSAAIEYKGRPFTSTSGATRVASVKSPSLHKEKEYSTLQQQDFVNIHKSRRTETPDILALFAPRPDTVIDLNQQTKSRRSSTSHVRSSHKSTSSSRHRSRERVASSSRQSNKVILQDSNYYNEIDA